MAISKKDNNVISDDVAYQDIGSAEEFRELKNRDFEIGD